MRNRSTSVKGEVPPLDDRLDNVLFDVWLVSRATTAWLDEVLAPSGLDSDEFAMYSVLRSREGMTPSELAHWMAAPATTVSSYVKRFEAKGHVEPLAEPRRRAVLPPAPDPAGKRAHARRREALPAGARPVNGHIGADVVAETHDEVA